MAKSLSTSSSERWPRAALLALLVIIVCELSIAALSDRLHFSYAALRMELLNKLANAPGDRAYDGLIIGDSYNHCGIMPARLRELTGLSCWNFSTYARMTTMASYALLRNYLSHCQRSPRWLVVGFLPLSLDLNRAQIEGTRPYFYNLREGNFDLLAREFGMVEAVKYYVPSLRHQFLLRRPATYARQLLTAAEVTRFAEQLDRDGGYYAYYADGVIADTETGYGDRDGCKFAPDEFSLHYLRAILDLAASRNIRLICHLTTAPPRYAALQDACGLTARQRAFYTAEVARYPGAVLLDPQAQLNRREWYTDTQHLNRAGAEQLTAIIAAELRRQGLCNDSPVTLPAPLSDTGY